MVESKSRVVMREHWENKYLNSCCLEKVPQGPSSLPLPKLGGLGGPLPYKKYKSFREKNTNHLEKKNKSFGAIETNHFNQGGLIGPLLPKKYKIIWRL